MFIYFFIDYIYIYIHIYIYISATALLREGVCGWSRSFVVWLFGFFENCQLGGGAGSTPIQSTPLAPPHPKIFDDFYLGRQHGCQNGAQLGRYTLIFWGPSWAPSWGGAGAPEDTFWRLQQASQNPLI